MDELFKRFRAAIVNNSHGTITTIEEHDNSIEAWYDGEWHIMAEWTAPEDRELVLKERTEELRRRK